MLDFYIGIFELPLSPLGHMRHHANFNPNQPNGCGDILEKPTT